MDTDFSKMSGAIRAKGGVSFFLLKVNFMLSSIVIILESHAWIAISSKETHN